MIDLTLCTIAKVALFVQRVAFCCLYVWHAQSVLYRMDERKLAWPSWQGLPTLYRPSLGKSIFAYIHHFQMLQFCLYAAAVVENRRLKTLHLFCFPPCLLFQCVWLLPCTRIPSHPGWDHFRSPIILPSWSILLISHYILYVITMVFFKAGL